MRLTGFAGPAVILNTMCEADQTKFDKQCPADFQCAQYVLDHGEAVMGVVPFFRFLYHLIPLNFILLCKLHF